VDFIALHHHAPDFDNFNTAVANFKAYIPKVHYMYKLPILVTKFAMLDYNVRPPW